MNEIIFCDMISLVPDLTSGNANCLNIVSTLVDFLDTNQSLNRNEILNNTHEGCSIGKIKRKWGKSCEFVSKPRRSLFQRH